MGYLCVYYYSLDFFLQKLSGSRLSSVDKATVREQIGIPVLSNGNVRHPRDVVENLQSTHCEVR